MLTFAPDGSTLALCGGDIDLTDQITIDISNVTLCCAGTTVFCNLFAAPNQRVLEVSGDSITIQDIRFFDGMSQDPGGNLFISAFGDHRLIRTGFFNGETDTAGGNVYITAPDGTLRVENSTFTEGTSGQQGGGLAVDGPVSVIIVDSVFSNNFSNQGGGGGLAITRGSDQSSGQTIVVESSEFAFNQAVLGAGFVFTTLGVGPTISVSSSRFMDNMADQSGGAGVFGQALEEIALSVENNSGSGNSAGDALLCNDFLAINGTTQRPVCIAVDETFTDP